MAQAVGSQLEFNAELGFHNVHKLDTYFQLLLLHYNLQYNINYLPLKCYNIKIDEIHV